MQTRHRLFLSALCAASLSVTAPGFLQAAEPAVTWNIESNDPALGELIDPELTIDTLASGFEWSEGPVWIPEGGNGYLLFSDVPRNRIHRWSESEGLSVFLEQAGFESGDASIFREPGTNGLIRYRDGAILAANHGQREITVIDLATRTKTTLVDEYDGQAFNTPNDLVLADNGNLYFTDPPFGLTRVQRSPAREISFSGVYLRRPDGQVSLIEGLLDFPNGVVLLPGDRSLIVSNADATRPVWMLYELDEQGLVINYRTFFDASEAVMAGDSGLPDGMAVDVDGNVFATGPGGIHVFNASGRLLGKIRLDRSAANVTFGGPDGSTLFITADDLLLQLPTRTRGRNF